MDVRLKQYQHEIDCHDWYYSFSDDGRVWRRGEEHVRLIRAIYSQLGAEDRQAAAVYCYDHAPGQIKEALAVRPFDQFTGI